MENIHFSFLPAQVVTPGDTLTLIPSRAMDEQTALKCITLAFEGATISHEVTVESNTIRIPTTGLAPGRYELRVNQPQATAGDASTGFMTRHIRPFTIRGHTYPVHSADGRRLRIQHSVTLAIRHTSVEPVVMRIAPGKPKYDFSAKPADTRIVEIVKAVYVDSCDDDMPIQLAFDRNGREIDACTLFEAVQERRFQRYGRIHETLWSRVQTMRPEDLVDIVVWPQVSTPPRMEDRPGSRGYDDINRPEELCKRREAILAHLKSLGAEIPERENRVCPELQHVMVYVYATLTVGRLDELAEATDVGAVMFNDLSAGVDLADSMAISRSNIVHTDLGFTGRGVKVAVFEQGPRNLSDLHFANRFTPNAPGSRHARLTSAIIKNTQRDGPPGHAPGCDLYSANSFGNGALEWAIAQGCTVISQSFHRQDETRSGILQTDDILHDWFAMHAPYPTFLHASGNLDSDNLKAAENKYVNHKGYNTLAIGSHDDQCFAVAPSSTYCNPHSFHGDRELPELCANGTNVTAVGDTMGGTSFAAPAAAGIVALLQEINEQLKSWPEGCRAILLAGSNRRDQLAGLRSTWWADVSQGKDARVGAGAIDARASCEIAQNRTPTGVAASCGWNSGILSDDPGVGSNRWTNSSYVLQAYHGPRSACLQQQW
ncbi:peptidase S8/S53 domain-containing protein [Terfezia claveryi]|nr:peptidase S8/S53 domain-containing protein [Terfezia claveryi]